MKDENYSIYDAKAKFSALLQRVKKGKRLVITHRGEPIARIIPYRNESVSLEDRLHSFESEGQLTKVESQWDPVPVQKKQGALSRFFEERE